MEHLEVFIAVLFVSVAGLNVLARRLSVPYPIPLVIGGLVLGLLPGMPDIELDPDLVLLIFLPPLLYSAAFFSDLRALRDNVRPISLLSIGLVLATIPVVAVLAHEVMEMPWAVAFVLGAIVAPTDPVAATAVMRRLGAPRRLVNVIEGESLVNDATALVAYRVAIAAALGGSFSLFDATLEFLGAATGGIAIGLVVGFAVGEIRRRIEDVPTELTISLLTAYAAFIPAEELGLSGVLAAVTCGVYLGWRAPEIASAQTRLEGFAVWSILVFLLNAVLFILIGLQLPLVLDGLEARAAGELIGYAALVYLAVVGTRFAWLMTVPYAIRALDRRPQQRARRIGWRERVVAGWSGLRGAVSLAAALALPLETDSGAAFPERDLILFITFALILATIVGQGLTLPALIRRLGIRADAAEEEAEEVRARLAAAKAALARLDELEGDGGREVSDDTLRRVRAMYEFRRRRFKAQAGLLEDDDDGIEDRSRAYQRLMLELYEAQRRAVVALRNDGTISNDVMHRVERDLDLEETRLEVTRG
ncbi:MAG: Na+/H+ antiporter [Actinomycetota bacterium]|nr:Na+/H+ antiporter [Actinomycetota bacterium]